MFIESLEREADSKLAGEGAWHYGAAWVDEAKRLEEAGGGVGDIDVVVGAVVGAVGHVERLIEELDVVAVVNGDGVRETSIELHEGQTVVRVVADLAAGTRAKAALVVGSEGGGLGGIRCDGCLCGVEVGHVGLRAFLLAGKDGGVWVAAATAYSPEIAGGFNDAERPCGADGEDGRDFEVPRKSEGACRRDVMPLVVGSGSAVWRAKLSEEWVGCGVAEGGGVSFEGDGLAVGVIDDGADVVMHRLPVTEVEGVVVGTADGFFDTEAAEDGNARSDEGG